MGTENAYSITLEPRFAPLEQFDVHAIAQACKDRWTNQTICRVNDSVVRLGVVQGEFHWHKHDNEDELFYLVEGKFIIELENRTVELQAGQGFTIPKGVVHRTKAPERAVVLMVEGAGVIPTGD
ncbi:MAG TPA: cupin domain-containing protein [Terriglobales bacterium]|nr:cupin domain-containing protein [Terriglobales bacterium]